MENNIVNVYGYIRVSTEGQMKVREQLKKEMTLADMESAKKEIKRVSSI